MFVLFNKLDFKTDFNLVTVNPWQAIRYGYVTFTVRLNYSIIKNNKTVMSQRLKNEWRLENRRKIKLNFILA